MDSNTQIKRLLVVENDEDVESTLDLLLREAGKDEAVTTWSWIEALGLPETRTLDALIVNDYLLAAHSKHRANCFLSFTVNSITT